MHRFLVVIQKAGGSFSAYTPDLPGCVATGATREEAEANVYEAIQTYLEWLLEDDLPVPEASTEAEYVLFKTS